MKISRFFHVWIPGRCWGPQNISGETFECFSHFLPKKFKFGYLWGTTDTSVYSWDPNDMSKRPKIAKKQIKIAEISQVFHVWTPGRCCGFQNISGETFQYFSHFLPKNSNFGTSVVPQIPLFTTEIQTMCPKYPKTNIFLIM